MQQKKIIAITMTAVGIRIGNKGFNNCSIPLPVMFAISSTPVFINPPTVRGITPRPFNRLSANCLGVMSVWVKFIEILGGSPVALQLRAPPKVSARAPAHRSYHFRGVKLKSCIKKIHHNLYISKQANVRIKHADTESASHKKFGTDARV